MSQTNVDMSSMDQLFKIRFSPPAGKSLAMYIVHNWFAYTGTWPALLDSTYHAFSTSFWIDCFEQLHYPFSDNFCNYTYPQMCISDKYDNFPNSLAPFIVSCENKDSLNSISRVYLYLDHYKKWPHVSISYIIAIYHRARTKIPSRS